MYYACIIMGFFLTFQIHEKNATLPFFQYVLFSKKMVKKSTSQFFSVYICSRAEFLIFVPSGLEKLSRSRKIFTVNSSWGFFPGQALTAKLLKMQNLEDEEELAYSPGLARSVNYFLVIDLWNKTATLKKCLIYFVP